jgi:hypothetical protein
LSSYNLSLSILGDIVQKSDFIVTVSFSPLDRYLAIGTRGGVLAIWRFIGASRDLRAKKDISSILEGKESSTSSSSAASAAAANAGLHHALPPPTSSDDWELYSKVSLSSSIHDIEWSTGQGTLCVIADEGVLVFSESILRSGQSGELSVLQTSSNEVSVQIGLSSPWIEATGLLIKGISVCSTGFCVWSGKLARVFEVDTALGRCIAHEPFAANANAIAIGNRDTVNDDSLFITNANGDIGGGDGSTNSRGSSHNGVGVSICSYRGVENNKNIAFSEAEGFPEHLDLHGTFLAVATSKGIIKVIDVKNVKKPSPLGSPFSFFSASLIGKYTYIYIYIS